MVLVVMEVQELGELVTLHRQHLLKEVLEDLAMMLEQHLDLEVVEEQLRLVEMVVLLRVVHLELEQQQILQHHLSLTLVVDLAVLEAAVEVVLWVAALLQIEMEQQILVKEEQEILLMHHQEVDVVELAVQV